MTTGWSAWFPDELPVEEWTIVERRVREMARVPTGKSYHWYKVRVPPLSISPILTTLQI